MWSASQQAWVRIDPLRTKMHQKHCIQLYATPQDVLENNTYNGQERQQGVLGRRHGIVRVGMIAPAGQQDPLGLVIVVHLLERHAMLLLSRS